MRNKLILLAVLVCCLMFAGCPGDEVVTSDGTKIVTTQNEQVIE